MDHEKELVLILVPAGNDPPVLGPEYQKELTDFDRSLRAQGLEVSSLSKVLESAGGGGLLSEFYIKLLSIVGSGGLLSLLGAWLQARYGRKVRAKIGDTEAEASSVEELRAVLKVIEEYRSDEQGRKGVK